jgi:hypothetical protein
MDGHHAHSGYSAATPLSGYSVATQTLRARRRAWPHGRTEDCGNRNASDHTSLEDGVCSSNSSLFRRVAGLYVNGVDDEVLSQLSQMGGGLVRGHPMEYLRADVRALAVFARKCSRAQQFNIIPWTTHRHVRMLL